MQGCINASICWRQSSCHDGQDKRDLQTHRHQLLHGERGASSPSLAGMLIAVSSEGWCFSSTASATSRHCIAAHDAPSCAEVQRKTSRCSRVTGGWTYVSEFCHPHYPDAFRRGQLMGMPFGVMPIFAKVVLRAERTPLVSDAAMGLGALVSLSLAAQKRRGSSG